MAKNDTIEEKVFAKQEREQDTVNAINWLTKNPGHEQFSDVAKTLHLNDAEAIEAIKWININPDNDSVTDVVKGLIKKSNLEASVTKIMGIGTDTDKGTKEVGAAQENVIKQLQDFNNPVGAIMASALKGISLGRVDEILAFGKAVQDKVISQDERDFGEIFEQRRSEIKKGFTGEQEKFPVISEIIETGTSFVNPLTRGVGKVAGKLGKVVGLAAESALVGGAKESDEGGDFVEGAAKGAAIGAGSGIFLKGAGAVLKGGIKIAEKITNSAVLKAVGAEGKAAANNLTKILKRKKLDVASFGEELAKVKTPSGKNVISAGDTIVGTSIKAREAIDAAGKNIGDLLDKAPNVQVNVKTVTERLFKKVLRPLFSSGNSDDKLIAKKLTNNLKDLVNKFGKDNKIAVKDLQEWRKRFSENVKQDPSKALNRATQEMDKVYRKVIDVVMAKAEKSGITSPGFLKAKKEYSLISTFIESLEKESIPLQANSITKVLSNLLVTKKSLAVAGVASLAGGGVPAALAIGTAVEVASRRSASTIISLTKRGLLNNISKSITKNIGKSGKFQPLLQKAARSGKRALVGLHYALSDLNPEYRKLMNIEQPQVSKGK